MRAFIYLFIYIGVVAGFAKIYQVFCPGDFYAPYAHLEKSWQEEEKRGNKALQTAFERSSSDYQTRRSALTLNDLDAIESDQAKKDAVHMVPIEQMKVSHFATDGKEISFYVYFEVPQVERTSTQRQVGVFAKIVAPRFKALQIFSGRLFTNDAENDAIVAAPEWPSSYSTLLPAGVLYLRLTGTIDPTPSIANPFFRSLAPYNANSLERKIYLDEDETSTLKDILDEYSGTSKRIGENYGRMLYLSVVISSTLGLGDIVPLSGLARLLVGTEVFLGIVLAGAFVNSVKLGS